MTVLVDTPVWQGPRGWLFAHLVSDHSYEELHDFARELGLSARAFDRDHYDIPEHLHARALTLGAEHVNGRELVTRLRDAGLRRPKAAPSGSERSNAGTALSSAPGAPGLPSRPR